MGENFASSSENQLEAMQKWAQHFRLDDEMVVLRLNASVEPAYATILLQHEDKKLLAHEESHYVPDAKRGFDHERDTMPFMTWGTWWFVDIPNGVYARRDFTEDDEGSIQGIVYALDAAMKSAASDEREWYASYITSLVGGDSLYGNVFERSVPVDQALIKTINVGELIKLDGEVL